MYGGKQTLYDVLGLPRDARPHDITRAYRRLSAEMQRESAAPNPRLAALLHEAHEVLSDPQKREQYDRSLQGPRFLGVAGGETPRRRWGLLVAGLALALGAAWYFTLGSAPEARRQGTGMSPQEIHTAASVSVGRVSRVEMSGARTGLGVAVAVEEGMMMAPCEGITPGAPLLVRIPPRDIPAQVASSDAAAGLCRLSVSGGASWPLPMTGTVPRIGDRVYAVNIGPLGEVVVSPGEVKQVIAVPSGSVIESTARAGAPVEGSPLLDNDGRLVAIAMKGRHTTPPRTWVVDEPIRRKPPPREPAGEAAAEPARPGAEGEDPRLKNVSPEKRERLEKAFRPPPSVPSDL